MAEDKDRKLLIKDIVETRHKKVKELREGRAKADALVKWFVEQEHIILYMEYRKKLKDIGVVGYPHFDVKFDGLFPPPGTPVDIIFTFEDGEDVVVEDKLEESGTVM